MINTPDAAPQRREALMKALVGELVEGGEFKDHATSMIDSGALDAFERERTGRV